MRTFTTVAAELKAVHARIDSWPRHRDLDPDLVNRMEELQAELAETQTEHSWQIATKARELARCVADWDTGFDLWWRFITGMQRDVALRQGRHMVDEAVLWAYATLQGHADVDEAPHGAGESLRLARRLLDGRPKAIDAA